MAKRKTNIFEIILRAELIGKTVYDSEGTAIIISELNYDPTVRCAYVSDGTNKFKIKVDDYFDFDFTQEIPETRVVPGQAKKFKNK